MEFPPVGVGDGPGFAGGHTGRWFQSVSRLTRSTVVADLLSLLVFYRGHWFFAEDVNFIRPYFKDFYRADLHALPTTIAFICVQSEIPISGTILKTVIGNHVISFSPATLVE